MKNLNSFIVASLIAVSSSAVMAQAKDEHAGHHPEPVSPAATATPKANMPSNQASQDMMKKMDEQMKAMQEIHQKMINAKCCVHGNKTCFESLNKQGGVSQVSYAAMLIIVYRTCSEYSTGNIFCCVSLPECGEILAKHCLRFPVTVRWLDPDVDDDTEVE